MKECGLRLFFWAKSLNCCVAIVLKFSPTLPGVAARVRVGEKCYCFLRRLVGSSSRSRYSFANQRVRLSQTAIS